MVHFLENYIGNSDWQCRYIQGRCSMYVVLSKEEQHVPYGELVGLNV